MTTSTNKLIEQLYGLTHTDIVLFDEWLYKGQPLIEAAADRLVTLIAELNKLQEAQNKVVQLKGMCPLSYMDSDEDGFRAAGWNDAIDTACVIFKELKEEK